MSDKHTTPDFAGEAYRACMAGNATVQQQASVAAQVILLNGLKGQLLRACHAAWNCIGELPPTQARVETAHMLQAAIEKAEGSA